MWSWLQDLTPDIRFAARLLLKDRRFTVAAVSALALGLGATVTAFTFVNGAVLRDLPFKDANRLIWIRTSDATGRRLGVSYADANDWKERARTLSHVIVSLEFAANVVEPSGTLPPQRYNGSYVSHDLFEMVGRAPQFGRAFAADDDRAGAPAVALLAHSVWTERYASDPSIVGRSVRINDVPTTIIGVMPDGFHFPIASEVWIPLSQRAGPPNTLEARRGSRPVIVFAYARLADHVRLGEAQAEMATIAARLAEEHPTTNRGVTVALEPVANLYWTFGGEFPVRRLLMVILAAVSFVLLIACVNVGNLLLARSAQRAREIAVRSALGASRGRVVRQLFIESLLLALVAGSCGLLLARWSVAFFGTQLTKMWGVEGPQLFWADFSMDPRVFGFLALVSLGSSVIFGLAPALYASSRSGEALKEGSRGVSGGKRERRWSDALLTLQLATTVVLVSGAGLMLRSFWVVYQAGRVIDSSNLITMQLALGGQKYAKPEQIKQFFHQLDAQLAAGTPWSAITVASDIPMMTVINAERQMTIAGREPAPGEPQPSVAYLYIGPRYFETLRLRLLRGREFTAEDGTPGHEAAIVNQRFASMFFPDMDPIGQKIRLTNSAAANRAVPWFTIVGVSPTVPQVAYRSAAEPVVYASVDGEPAPHRFVSIIARADGPRGAVVTSLRDEVRKVDADLPAYYIKSMDEILATSRQRQQIFSAMLAMLGVIALVLATVGLYAVTAHGVKQRTREIGIRIALGADPREVVWLFVRRTVLVVLIGLGTGLVGAVALGRQLEQLLVRTPPADPMTFGLVILLLVATALIASAWPARKAARVSPMIALRYE